MKKYIALISFILSGVITYAQSNTNIVYTSEDNIGKIKKNVEFVINSVDYPGKYIVTFTQQGTTIRIDADELPTRVNFKAAVDNLDNYWYARNFETLPVLDEIPNLFYKRAGIEAEASKYLSYLYSNNLVFEDPYLESYVYSLVSKISPSKRADGFPYDLRIVLLRDPDINAAAFPNGIMTVNVGLLASAHTEDELVAVLAHEMAHYVANHYLVNYKEMEEKKDKAEFWAAFATSMAAVTEAMVASYGNYRPNGSLTAAAAAASKSLATSFIERIGMKFSSRQEENADKMALEVLKYLGYDKNAAATMFQRMADSFTEEGNWDAYILSGDHPSLKNRIEYSGTPNIKARNADYEKKISFAISEVALMKMNNGRFRQAIALVNQNISNGVATGVDYWIKAESLLSLYDDSTHNEEALTSASIARNLDSIEIAFAKTEIVAALRLNNVMKAEELLEGYKSRIDATFEDSKERESSYLSFLTKEYDWAQRMLIKVKGL